MTQASARPAQDDERPERFLKRAPLYTLLLAAWPTIRLYGDNPGEFRLEELVWPTLACLLVALATLMVLRAIWREPRRAGIVTAAFVVPFLTFGLFAGALGPVWPHEPLVRSQLLVLVVWVGLLVITAYVATRLDRTGPLTEALNLVALALTVTALLPVAVNEITERSRGYASALADDASTANGVASAERPLRDIYHLVLDRYGSADALATGLGIDNSSFVESLRERGFDVIDDAHANFERTVLSLASTFDMSLLEGVGDRMGIDHPSSTPLYELVRANPVGSMLQQLGYRYVHMGSWYHQTASSDTADQVERPVHLVDFQSVLLDQTAISGIATIVDVISSMRPDGSDERLAKTTLRQLERLHAVAEQPGPKYVFAHILVPHQPYVFLSDGSISPADATFGTQLGFANAELDRIIERLLDVPANEQPIIIVQGDEGPYPPRYDPAIEDFDWQTATNEELVTKFGVLNAMFLPGPEGGRPLPNGMTLVNTYPEVLDRYFGISVERAANRIFATHPDRPYDRLDLTGRVQRARQELRLDENPNRAMPTSQPDEVAS